MKHDKVTNQAFVDIGICNGTLNMKIDTGAKVNVIPTSQYYNLPSVAGLQHTPRRLKAYDGSQLKVGGFVKLKCRNKGTVTKEEFYIVDTPTSHPILGLEMCMSLNLIKFIHTMDIDRR